MNNNRFARSRATSVLAGLSLSVLSVTLGAQTLIAPKYKFDPGLAQALAEQLENGRRHGAGRG